MNHLFLLRDVEQANREHPDTFHISSKQTRSSIPIGSHAKLIFQLPNSLEPNDQTFDSERMWVKVTRQLPDGTYEGILDNDPLVIPIKAGDQILFEPKHVANILTP